MMPKKVNKFAPKVTLYAVNVAAQRTRDPASCMPAKVVVFDEMSSADRM